MEAVARERTDRQSEKSEKPDSARVIADASIQVKEILANGIMLAGRTWMPVRAPTFEQQNLRTRIVGRSGVIRLFPSFDVVNDDPDALAGAVMAMAFANGVLFEMLGALLIEDGTTWTPAVAHANALLFASLTDAEDHARLADAILWLVLDFFLSVSDSSRIFLKSLVLSGNGERKPRLATPSALPNSTGEGDSAATSISDAGTTSSAPSPATAEPTS